MIEVMRFTDDALATLDLQAQENPQLWADPNTDFYAVLRNLGIKDIDQSAGIQAHGPISMPPVTEHPHSRGDRSALEFADNLEGFQTKHLRDINLLAWLSCIHLKDWAVSRWPQNAGATNWIRQHFLDGRVNRVTRANLAGRTLWLAHIARKAADASAASLDEGEILDHLCSNPEHYHTAVSFNVLNNSVILAEYLRAQIKDADKHDTRGLELAKAINLRAGGIVIDALPRDVLRAICDDTIDRLRKLNAKPVINVLSLGAGVQSSVLALMAEQGYSGMSQPDFAIFADTGWEPKSVYEHLDWLETQLSYPVVRVSAGNIRDNILAGQNPEGRPFIDLPFYVTKPDGKSSTAARQCTNHYKIAPIRQYLRQYLNVPAGKPVKDAEVHMWLGISCDEASRQKPSRYRWIVNQYPLLKREYSRQQLVDWFQERYPGRTLPKSACIGCPFHSDAAWSTMKTDDPESWNDAVGVDWALRNVLQAKSAIAGTAYLHSSRKPLSEIDFGNAAAAADAELQAECEGICGI